MVALLLCAEIARLSVASIVAEDDPAFAARLAPDNPAALIAAAMAGVGRAAAAGSSPDQATLARFRTAAELAPLRAEPFAVHGALAERSGDDARAERLLRAARWRDPRSTATRYLLADLWLRQGDVTAGLGELAILSRIFPAASVQLVPALAQYARTPGAREQLSAVLRSNPKLKEPLLNALAADPANARLILALAGPDARSSSPEALRWKARLLGGFVRRGDYDQAYRLWRAFSGETSGPAPLLFNGSFSASAAPPPFNWSFASGSAGVAEPADGKLRVLYYGRENASLASQLLLLAPGRYTFQAPVTGTAAEGSLGWTLSCVSSGKSVMTLAVGAEPPAASFAIPDGCPAQLLELRGHAQDMPESSDLRIGPVAIARAAP